MNTSPPGWHVDPLGRYQHRYWDGNQWTDQVSDAGQPGTDPLGIAPTPAPSTPAPPVQTSLPPQSPEAAQAKARDKRVVFGASKPMWSFDINGRHERRYHDGQNWTDHVSDNGVVSTDPFDPYFTPEYLAVFKRAEYLGGHAALGEPLIGKLFISSEAIGIGDVSHGSARIPISDVASVELMGGQVALSKIVNVIAFGLFGLASKGSKNLTSLGVRTSDGEIAYYLIDQAELFRVRAQLMPVFKMLNVPFGDAAQ